MDDLISRQAAINAIVDCTNCKTADELRAYVTKHTLDNGWTGGFVDALDAVEDLPSAQPERPKGKWITQEFGSWAECSECHELYDIPMAYSNFCPNCGADMRGEQDG